MSKFIGFLFIVLIHESYAQYSIHKTNNLMMRNLELALKQNRITIDQLLEEIAGDEETNEISQIDGMAQVIDEQMSFIDAWRHEPDYGWNAKEMIEYRGFKFEEHHVVTEDCYVLTMHRIVNPLNKTANKPPALLQHGLFDSSVGWLINAITGDIHDDDDRNLGFALAKRGYDVWLGNYRGNTYSKNHTTFPTNNPNFWKFNFDNHALQDLPAQIAHIQNVTNYDQIIYVGHSQGTLTMFELLSLKPQVAKSIRPFIALAPVAHLGNLASPIRYLAASRTLMRLLLYRNAELLPNTLFSRVFSTLACRAFPGLICKNFLYLICGFSEHQLNSTRMPVYFNHFPTGSSLANLVHFGLNYRSKKPQLLDYMSAVQNMECYNSPMPPVIPLDKITLNEMYLISSLNDLLASPRDVELLKQDLKVNYTEKIVELKEFGHVDFTLSQRSDYYVNDYIIKILEDKKPMQNVPESERARLKKYTEDTCTVHNQITHCHLDVERALRMII